MERRYAGPLRTLGHVLVLGTSIHVRDGLRTEYSVLALQLAIRTVRSWSVPARDGPLVATSTYHRSLPMVFSK